MAEKFQLIAAPHAPLDEHLAINLSEIEHQFSRLMESDVSGAFINGTTGESLSLNINERKEIAARWDEVSAGTDFRVIVHVGHNTQSDAIDLSRHCSTLNVAGIAAFSPNYYRPVSMNDLIQFFAPIAGSAEKPFYYYDIPGFTNVHLPVADMVLRAREIPGFAGVKFSNPNLIALQDCLDASSGKFETLFGCDEALITALPLGIQGAVGSTYNFCASLYHDLVKAFHAGDYE